MAAMLFTEEPLVSRLDRLDVMMRHLEEIKGYNRSSPRSSFASTLSHTTDGGEGGGSSVDSSPRSIEKHCRPIDTVMMETEIKGNLLDRLHQVEDRLLKLCGESLEAHERETKKMEEEEGEEKKKKEHKSPIKQFVKSCVKGKPKSKKKK